MAIKCNKKDIKYIMRGILLYKIINKTKKYYEVVEVPTEFEEFTKIDDMEGTLKIKYYFEFDTEPLEKFKVYNDEFKNIEWYDKFCNDIIIKNNIFLFDSLFIEGLDATYYKIKKLIHLY